MTIEAADLAPFDARGYEVLDALTHEGRHSATYSASNTFVCIDGKTYWAKAVAQQGLVAELIAGRLAAKVGAGPAAKIIRVPMEALPVEGDLTRLAGVVVGLEDEPDTVNARDLGPLLGTKGFDPGAIDPSSRAMVVAFQTWLGVGDTQVLINLKDGRVRSIDHGECFSSTETLDDPSLIVVPIPGIDPEVGRDQTSVDAAIAKVVGVTDRQIVEAVTRIPLGEPWRSPGERRLEIARWLARRRDRIKEVMLTWLPK